MIKDEIIAKRYADALMGFLKETMGLEKGLDELKNLKDTVIKDNPGFLKLLESMEITYAEKSDFIDRVLKDGFSEEIRQFLKLLLRKKRIDKLNDILEYIRIMYSYVGKGRASLKSRYPVDPETVKAIQDSLEKKFQKQFKVDVDLDNELLGGARVMIGNIVIDGSIRRRLDELRETLKTARV